MLSALLKPSLFGLAMLAGMSSFGSAQAEVLLTIEAKDGQTVTYTREELDALPRVSFSTGTVWTKGQKEFSGVALKSLLTEAGITEGMIQAVAVNDYVVEIPVDSLEDDAPIVADRIDGETFSRRDNGPLWIMFPFDKDVSYRTEENYSRSVWQLVRLSLK